MNIDNDLSFQRVISNIVLHAASKRGDFRVEFREQPANMGHNPRIRRNTTRERKKEKKELPRSAKFRSSASIERSILRLSLQQFPPRSRPTKRVKISLARFQMPDLLV